MRKALNAIMYVLSTGCQWRYLPRDFPPRSTVYRYFCDWGFDGTLDRIHDETLQKCLEQPDARPAPPPLLSTARAWRSAEKNPMQVDGGRTW